MMNYCIVENDVIVNIIVCESDEIAVLFNALPAREDAKIGESYVAPDPVPEPKPEPTDTDVLNALLGVIV